MAHDPSLGFADYFSAADAASAAALMPAMDHEGAPELYGLHSGMELLGMHRVQHAAAMPEQQQQQQQHEDGAGSTMRFFLDQQQQQQHHLPSQQAPLSLSLHQQQHHHLGLSSQPQQQEETPVAAWMLQQNEQHDPAPHAHGGYVHGAAWHLRSSRFLHPAQQLLQGFCSLPVDSTAKRAKPPPPPQKQEDGTAGGGEGSSSSTSGWPPSAQIQAMDALELQRLKDKLYVMLEEVDRRYRRYCEQMRGLAGGFEAVAGERAAAGYTALAAQTISKHFRSLRDGIVAQLQAVRKALGEKDVSAPRMTRGDTPRLKVLDQCIRQQKAMHQNGGFMESHPWRPQRGLPERAVTILRAWLFEHFLHPYPSDVDKHILARQTGLSRSQGLMERAGNLLERAEAALERLSLPPVVLQVEPTSPLSTGGNADCADEGVDRFGCYSPRSVSLSASPLARDFTPTPIAALEHVSPVMQGPPMKDLRVEMTLSLEELGGSDTPSPEEKIAKVMAQFDAIEPQEKTLPSLMTELCREIVDMPKDKQLRLDVPSLVGKRSIRLDKKNKDCVIPTAKRAEFRRAESFGEIPKLKSKEKATGDAIEEKMEVYLQLYKKQPTPQVLEAFRALVVSNWFINARVRLWKPMVEEMYVEEMKADDGVQVGGINPNGPSSSSSHASDGQRPQAVADEGDRVGGGDRKPTLAQLHVVHDTGSLASVVNIAGADAERTEGFGVMGTHHYHHTGFDAYDGNGQGFGGGVSLTLGLQQHDTHDGGGVNIAFGAPSEQHGAGGFLYPGEQMDAVHSAGGHGHHIQFGAVAGEASHGGQDQHYRDLSAGFHLLRDLAG